MSPHVFTTSYTMQPHQAFLYHCLDHPKLPDQPSGSGSGL